MSAVGFGLVTAAILAICALGFTLQFAVTNVFNLAYGSIMTGGGFIAYALNSSGVNIWAAMAAAGACGGIISLGLNALIYGPFIRHGLNLFGMVIVTIATGLICDNLVQAAVGPNFFSYHAPAGGSWGFADMSFTTQELVVIAIAVVLMTATRIGLTRTRTGKAMRGLSVNAALARACGIPTRLIIAITWFASGVMAAVGAVALFMDASTFSPATTSEFLILVIAAAVLGGVGSAEGAFVGALVVGIVTEIAGAYWNPELKNVVAFGVLVAVLLARPQGIFAQLSTEKEVVG
jgi:branched-chain amino acid transport system permease protein/neutral amino acid transport system permease protein